MKTMFLLIIGILFSANCYAQAPTSIEKNAVIFIEASEFGQAISAAILKKEVPVLVTTNRDKATFFIEESSKLEKEAAGERIAKVLVYGGFAGSGKTYEASVTLTNIDGTVIFAHNSKKGDMKKAAEDVAKKLRDHIAEKQ